MNHMCSMINTHIIIVLGGALDVPLVDYVCSFTLI